MRQGEFAGVAQHLSLNGPGGSPTSAPEALRIAYADPPYIGQAKRHYGNHPDYAGEVDHSRLIYELVTEYDGYVLHASSVSLPNLLERFAIETNEMPRVMAWVKPFAVFKRNVPVAYAWEPVLVKAARKPVVSRRITPLRDWFSASAALTPGFAGAKPDPVCKWLFEVVGAEPQDDLFDLFPGTGAVGRAWDSWRNQLRLGAG